jgi:hypothetical protein
VCLDTYKHAVQAAMKHERQTFGRRQQLLKSLRPWSWAHATIDIPRIVDYTPSVGSFAQVMYMESFFEAWRAYLMQLQETYCVRGFIRWQPKEPQLRLTS